MRASLRVSLGGKSALIWRRCRACRVAAARRILNNRVGGLRASIMAQPLPTELSLALQCAPRRLLHYLLGDDALRDTITVPPVRRERACMPRSRAALQVKCIASASHVTTVVASAFRHQELVRTPRAVCFILGALLRPLSPPAMLDDDVFAFLFKARARNCVRSAHHRMRQSPLADGTEIGPARTGIR